MGGGEKTSLLYQKACFEKRSSKRESWLGQPKSQAEGFELYPIVNGEKLKFWGNEWQDKISVLFRSFVMNKKGFFAFSFLFRINESALKGFVGVKQGPV